jgi:uncharacterized protein YkwD
MPTHAAGPNDPAVPTPEVTPLVSLSATARYRYAMVGCATAVVIGIGFTAAGLHQRSTGDDPSPRSADALLVAPAPSEQATPGLLDNALSADPSVPPSPTASPSPSVSKAPVKQTKAPVKTTKPTRKPSGGSAPATDDKVINAVLAHINAARTAAGLSAYTFDAQLSKASALHNQKMIAGCGLSHQCPGEQGIGARFIGVPWTFAAENIGFGSSGASDDAIISAANGLTDSMLAEKPPNDGHRQNLLSDKLKKIGLSVVRDSSGKTWMTQDFVN